MPLVSSRVDLCEGHDACAPRELASYSADVTVEGFEVARQEDALKEHGCPQHPPHAAVITAGWQTVTVNNRPIGCVGAGVSCPSGVMSTGRPTVTVGR